MKRSSLCLTALSAVFSTLMTMTAWSATPAGGGCQIGFENVAQLPDRGWIFKNNSDPRGSSNWFQGDAGRFPAQAGPASSYLSADRDNASGVMPVVSNWAITPAMEFRPGLSLSFYTRALGTPASADDRLIIRVCVQGPGINCLDPGDQSGSQGDYAWHGELLAINEDSQPGGYPSSWTAYTVTAAHGLPTSGRGRIAFHYYNMASAPGAWGSTIGIDSLAVNGDPDCGLTDTLFRNGFQGH